LSDLHRKTTGTGTWAVAVVVVVLVEDVPNWLALGCFFLKKDILPALIPGWTLWLVEYIVGVCFEDRTQGANNSAKGVGYSRPA